MRIELVGGMGLGKTTLCKVFEQIGFNCIYEDLGENPFIADFYEDTDAFRFPCQLWFIAAKYAELQKKMKTGHMNVMDQAVLNCRAYANILFKENDADGMEIINQSFRYIDKQFGKPDVVINLKCSPEVQKKRIQHRNRSYEQEVELDYLYALQHEIGLLINEAKADGQEVIDIDTEQIFIPGNRLFAEELAFDIANRCGLQIDQPLPLGDTPAMQPTQRAFALAFMEDV
jgi:deoxyadenosine/deoxycytidine kinase